MSVAFKGEEEKLKIGSGGRRLVKDAAETRRHRRRVAPEEDGVKEDDKTSDDLKSIQETIEKAAREGEATTSSMIREIFTTNPT